MKVICKTPFPEATVFGFANPNRPSGGWVAGDTIEVNDNNKVVVSHLLRTDEWEAVPDKKSKYEKSTLED